MDAFNRPIVSPSIKAAIDSAFTVVPSDKRGALLIIADEHGTRATLAAKLNDHWRVAAGGGIEWAEKKPFGFVAIEATW